VWRTILAVLTTQQILSFIQYKIATTHAAGGDICELLENPEVAFSLHVLDGNYSNFMQVPAVAANDNDYELVQRLVIDDTNINDGLGQTPNLMF
jgi:hypothetical protein